MADKKLKHEPTYSSRISSMRQFIILFCIGIGVVGLLIYVPIVLFCIYMLAVADHIIIYILAVGGLHIFTGVGIYCSRLIYREAKQRIIDNRYPSGFDLMKDGISFQFFRTETNQYVFGDIPYVNILKCIISIHAEPILEYVHQTKSSRIAGYEYQPFIHILYDENGQTKRYSVTSRDEETTLDLLSVLHHYHIPLELTEYDLDIVPEQMLDQVLTEDISTHILTDPYAIKHYIDSENLYDVPPERYTAAYTEWLIKERGVTNREQKPWQSILVLIVLGIASAIGFVLADDPGFLVKVLIPYIAIASSYIVFVYYMKELAYWKTIYHFVLSFVVFSIILIITGQEPFVFYRENTEVIIKTIENPISEAVMGTLIGFYGGSYIIFEVTRIYIREKWPAQFHEKIARFLEKVSS